MVETLTDPARLARQQRFEFALKLQEIEGNPLDAEQIALFDQFDRDGLTDEQRRLILIARAEQLASR